MNSRIKSVGQRALGGSAQLSGVYVLAILVVIYSVIRPGTFPTVQNLQILLGGQAVSAILAIGLILPMACNLFDLSVGAAMGMAVIMVGFLQSEGMNPVLATLVAVAMGIVIGAVNATVIIVFDVSPIIATLGSASILSAVAYWMTAGQGVYSGISSTFFKAGLTQVLGVPITVLYLVVFVVIIYYLLEHTNLGRSVRAVGGNAEAARLSGIRVNRVRAFALIAGSVMACIAGVVYTARIGSAPLNAGDPFLLSSFAAVFLGSTQLKRGRFNVVGTLIAIYLLAVGVNGLQLVYPNNAWLTQFFQGIVLIIAVAFAVERHWGRKRRRNAAADSGDGPGRAGGTANTDDEGAVVNFGAGDEQTGPVAVLDGQSHAGDEAGHMRATP
jgi:ribose transport system permease protein